MSSARELNIEQLRAAMSSPADVRTLLTTHEGGALDHDEQVRATEQALTLLRSHQDIAKSERVNVLETVHTLMSELEQDVQKQIATRQEQLRNKPGDAEITEHLTQLNILIGRAIEQRRLAREARLEQANYLERQQIQFSTGNNYDKAEVLGKAAVAGTLLVGVGGWLTGLVAKRTPVLSKLKQGWDTAMTAPVLWGASIRQIKNTVLGSVFTVGAGVLIVLGLVKKTDEAKQKEFQAGLRAHQQNQDMHSATAPLAPTTQLTAAGDALTSGPSILGSLPPQATTAPAGSTDIDAFEQLTDTDLTQLVAKVRSMTGTPQQNTTALHSHLFDEHGARRDLNTPAPTAGIGGLPQLQSEVVQQEAEAQIIARITGKDTTVVDAETVRTLAEMRPLTGRLRGLQTLRQADLDPATAALIGQAVVEQNQRIALNRGEQAMMEDLLRTAEQYHKVKQEIEASRRTLIAEKAKATEFNADDQTIFGEALANMETSLASLTTRETQLRTVIQRAGRSLHLRSLIEQVRLAHGMLEEDGIATALNGLCTAPATAALTVTAAMAQPGASPALQGIPAALRARPVSEVAPMYRTLQEQVGQELSREQVQAWIGRLRAGIERAAAADAGADTFAELKTGGRALQTVATQPALNDTAYLAALEQYAAALGADGRRQMAVGQPIEIKAEGRQAGPLYVSRIPTRLANGMLIDAQNLRSEYTFRRLFLGGNPTSVGDLGKAYKDQQAQEFTTQNDNAKLATMQMENFLIGMHFGPQTQADARTRGRVATLLPREIAGLGQNTLPEPLRQQLRTEWQRYGMGISEYATSVKHVTAKYTEKHRTLNAWASEQISNVEKKVKEKVMIPSVSAEQGARILGAVVLASNAEADYVSPRGISELDKLLGGKGLNPQFNKLSAGAIMDNIWPTAINREELGKFLSEYPQNLTSQSDENKAFQAEFETKANAAQSSVQLLETLQAGAPPESLALSGAAPVATPVAEITAGSVQADLQALRTAKSNLRPNVAATQAAVEQAEGKLMGDYLALMRQLSDVQMPEMLKSSQAHQTKLTERMLIHANNYRMLDGLSKDWWKEIFKGFLAKAFLLNPAVLATEWARLMLQDQEFRDAFMAEVNTAGTALDNAHKTALNEVGKLINVPDLGTRLHAVRDQVVETVRNPAPVIRAAENTIVAEGDKLATGLGLPPLASQGQALKDQALQQGGQLLQQGGQHLQNGMNNLQRGTDAALDTLIPWARKK